MEVIVIRVSVALLGLIVLVGAGCSSPPPKEAAGTGEIKGGVVSTVDAALSQGKSQNKPILLVAYQGNPDDIDMMILSEPSVTQKSEKFVVAKVDGNSQAAALANLNVSEYPTILILRPDGTEAWRKKSPTPPDVAAAMDLATGVAPAP